MSVYIWSTEITNAYIGIPYPESISLDRNSISLTTIWQTVQLTATILPTVSDKTITWTSSDNTIATVSSSWLVTCITPWECTITATTVNSLTATCTVKEWLPSTYQEVEYIESSWTQWIDTWVTPTQNTMSQIKFVNLVTTWDVIYWMYTWDDTDYRFFNASWTMYFDFGSSRIEWSSVNTNTVYELEIWNYYVKNVWASSNILSWSTITSYTWWTTITLNNYNNSSYSQNRWYYVKIYDSWTLVRDMIPCYRIADTEIWMYDLENWVFYTNAGSWTFTKWADV